MGLGYGLLFDGTDDYVTFGGDGNFNFTTGAFTVEFPFYFEANPGSEKKIVSRGSDSNDGWSVVLTTAGKIGLRTNQASAQQTTLSTALTPGVPVWVSVTRSAAAGKVFVNGLNVTDSAATHVNPLTASRTLYLGRNNAGTDFIHAIVPELRIWSGARSREDINATMNRALTGAEITAAGANLLLYAKLNEGTGTAVTNSGSVGSAADGTLTGGPTWVHSGTGHAGLVGQKLPDLWGPVRGWEPELIDPVRSIYFLSSLPINALLRVDVGGLSNMVAESATTSLFTLLSSTPAAGKYRLCTVAGGTWLRLGSKPSRKLTVDVEGNAPGGTYLENASQQVRYLVANRGLTPLTDPTDLDTDAFDDLETANDAPVGHGYRDDVSVAEVAGFALRTVGAMGFFRNSGLYAVERFEGAAAKTPAITLTQRDIARGTFEPLEGGVPVATVNLLFQRNHTVLSPTDLLPGVAGTDREVFATKEWQSAGQTDWAAKQDFKNAQTLEEETGFDTFDEAMAEASRRLQLFNAGSQPFLFLCRQRGVEIDRLSAIALDYQDLDRFRTRQSRLATGSATKFVALAVSPDIRRGGFWVLAWREEIT